MPHPPAVPLPAALPAPLAADGALLCPTLGRLLGCPPAPTAVSLQNERDDTVDDLVKSDFLHEPGCGPIGCSGLCPALSCQFMPPAAAPRGARLCRLSAPLV